MSLSAQLKLLRRTKISESSLYGEELDRIVSGIIGVTELPSDVLHNFVSTLAVVIEDSDSHWEVVNFSIQVLTKLCSLLSIDHFGGVIRLLKSTLEHEEPRVRMQACSLISFVASVRHEESGLDLLNYLLLKLMENMIRADSTRPTLLGDVSEIALDDTTGWNKLESYLVAVHSTILAQVGVEEIIIRDAFVDTLVSVGAYSVKVYELLLPEFYLHQNRHIREITLSFISQYLAAWNNRKYDSETEYSTLTKSSKYAPLFEYFVAAVEAGMKDNWSQIRLKAIHACRDVLLCLVANAEGSNVLSPSFHDHWPRLLPGLCLNRYYTAEAVQNAALSTWRDVITSHGKALISLHADVVVSYYVEASRSSNHMVAEAACVSLGEFIAKLDRDTVVPHVSRITEALSACLKDERWPVKDQACVPTGMLVRFYPDETRDKWSNFVELWNTHLKDCIWSVRENAALAYAAAVQCAEAASFFLAHIEQYLATHLLSALNDKISSVKPSMKNFSFLPPSMLVSKSSSDGGAKKVAVMMEDDKIPSLLNETMNSAPPRKSWGCCVDCVELRQSLPWEVTQGALYLLREIVKTHPDIVRRQYRVCTDNVLLPVEEVVAGSVSLVNCLSLLLSAEHLNHSDKLHNAVYEEFPSVLSVMPSSFDFSTIAHPLSRDLTSEESGDVIDSSTNRNEAKYKVNRVPNSSSSTTRSIMQAGAGGGMKGSSRMKSARRIMAEKCVERLLSQGCLSKSVLISLLTQSAKEVVEAMAVPTKSRSKFDEYFS